MGEENLGDLVTMRKPHKRVRWILPMQYARLGMEVARKIEVLFDRLSFVRRQFGQVGTRQYVDGETFRTKIICHSSSSSDEHSRCGIISDVNKNPIGRTLIRQTNVDFVRRLPQCQLTQSRQRLLFE